MTRVNLLENNFRLSANTYRTVASWLRAGADTLGAILLFAILIAMILLAAFVQVWDFVHILIVGFFTNLGR